MAIVMRFVFLTVAQVLWVTASFAEPAGSAAFEEEVAKQAAIYQSRGEDVPEGYVTDRSLLSYTVTLPAGFNRSLASLGPDDRWLDIGAGEGRAILDYCTSKYDAMRPRGTERRGKKAKAIAISIEDRRTSKWHQIATTLEEKQVQYLFGRRLREYSLNELGKFQVISDVLGGFSYARDLSLFMKKALGFLEVNGKFFTLLQDVRSEDRTNRPFYPNASFLTEIIGADGSQGSVCSWLKSIGCVQVTCELKAETSPPIERYRIHKICDEVRVPRLVPLHFEAGTPPERRYQLQEASPTSLEGISATRR